MEAFLRNDVYIPLYIFAPLHAPISCNKYFRTGYLQESQVAIIQTLKIHAEQQVIDSRRFEKTNTLQRQEPISHDEVWGFYRNVKYRNSPHSAQRDTKLQMSVSALLQRRYAASNTNASTLGK
jgi:hypothetical protein